MVETYLTKVMVVAVAATTGVILFPKIYHNFNYGPSPACRKSADPEREEWQRRCDLRNSPGRMNYQEISDSVFENIEQRRINKSLAQGCNPNLESWYCVLDQQTGKYQALFYDLPGESTPSE